MIEFRRCLCTIKLIPLSRPRPEHNLVESAIFYEQERACCLQLFADTSELVVVVVVVVVAVASLQNSLRSVSRKDLIRVGFVSGESKEFSESELFLSEIRKQRVGESKSDILSNTRQQLSIAARTVHNADN